MSVLTIFRPRHTLFVLIALIAATGASPLRAQTAPGNSGGPAATLADIFQAACRQDTEAFAGQLTAENATAFRKLPPEQRIALLKRFVLLDDPGDVLLSNDAQGNTVIRCQARGVLSEVRFGTAQVHDNLAFIPVVTPEAGEGAQSGRFGLVREDGQWKLLSLGLLLMDVPALAQEWARADLAAHEMQAVQALRSVAEALEKYRQAYGRLPETLAQLGPAGTEGKSPEQAGFLDGALASGEDQGYRFRYSIVPASQEADESDRDKLAGFQLAATPADYGKNGLRSFYLDARGVLRGADKSGGVATADDPAIREPH